MDIYFKTPRNSDTGKKITEIIKIHDKYHDATIKAINKTVVYSEGVQEYITSLRYSLVHKQYYVFVVHPLWVSNVPSDCIKITIEEYKKLFNETFI